MSLTPQLTNLGLMLFLTQAAKKVPMEDPNVLNGVRALYIVSNLIIIGIFLYIQSKINAKKDMTTLKYVEPPQMGSQEDPKLVTTTIHAYDLAQMRTLFRGQLMGVAIMGFMHLYMKYTSPLLIQSIIPVKSALEGNMVKIHLWGKPASGDLKRPFKAAGNGIMGAMSGQTGAGEIKTDRASIEAAEKAGRGGAKEE